MTPDWERFHLSTREFRRLTEGNWDDTDEKTPPRQPDLITKIPCEIWVLKGDVTKEPKPEGTFITPTAHPDIWIAWRPFKEATDETDAAALRSLRTAPATD